MPVKLPALNKRYYTTGEVAAMFGLTRSTVRYWERKFDIIRTHKFGNGERRFTVEQVRTVQKIHTLVKERGFTLQGAEKELEEKKEWYRGKDEIVDRLQNVRKGLDKIRMEL